MIRLKGSPFWIGSVDFYSCIENHCNYKSKSASKNYKSKSHSLPHQALPQALISLSRASTKGNFFSWACCLTNTRLYGPWAPLAADEALVEVDELKLGRGEGETPAGFFSLSFTLYQLPLLIETFFLLLEGKFTMLPMKSTLKSLANPWKFFKCSSPAKNHSESLPLTCIRERGKSSFMR